MVLTILKIIPFVLLGLFILFGSHYLLYRSVIGLFGVTKPSVKMTLLFIAFFLSLSFILAEVITRFFKESWLVKYFYIGAAAWLGLVLNFLLAMLLIWLVSRLTNILSLDISRQIVSGVIFSLAIIFSVYGFWNAFHPKIENIEVQIKNLPVFWQNKIIVQLSDLHLGNVHGVGFLEKVVEKANEIQPDLVFITGDLFDGIEETNLGIFVEPLNKIQAKSGIFFVTGNHEVYLGIEKALAILKETGIKVLNDEMVELDGLQIVGIGYPAQDSSPGITGKSKNIGSAIASLKNFDKTRPSILLYHAPTNIEQVKAAGINLQLSGHTHQGQIFPIGLIDRLIYGKYYYGFFKEGDFSIYATSGTGTWGPPMRTLNTPEIVVIKIQGY